MAVYQFTPSITSTFQFQPIFDGVPYNVIVTWNLFGMRYYINIYDQFTNLVVTLPLIGSASKQKINITAGYFTTQLVYFSDFKQFVTI